MSLTYEQSRRYRFRQELQRRPSDAGDFFLLCVELGRSCPVREAEIEMSVLGFIRARWDLMNIKVEDDVGFSDDLKVFEASFLLSSRTAAACALGSSA